MFNIDDQQIKIFIACGLIAFWLINIFYFCRLVAIRYKMQNLMLKINRQPIDKVDIELIMESQLFSINPGYVVTYGDLMEIKRKILLLRVKK